MGDRPLPAATDRFHVRTVHLVLGRHDNSGRLRSIGRTVALRPDQARQVAEHLEAADPGHPWTGARFAAAWGSREVLDVVLVRPDLVAEVSAGR